MCGYSTHYFLSLISCYRGGVYSVLTGEAAGQFLGSVFLN